MIMAKMIIMIILLNIKIMIIYQGYSICKKTKKIMKLMNEFLLTNISNIKKRGFQEF